MQVASVGTSAGQTSKSSTGRSIGADDFLQLLITQLRSQDPFQPMSNEQMLSQVATIQQMQASAELTDTLQAFASRQEFGSASALIGKFVRGVLINASGSYEEVSGTVSAVHFASSGQVVLELDGGQMLPIDGVVEVEAGDHDPASGASNAVVGEAADSGSQGDVNGDGRVDALDVQALAEAYSGPNVSTDEPRADLDGDGDVDADDLRILAAHLATAGSAEQA
jgi:flagellar basal-body rod modification protein FlgD